MLGPDAPSVAPIRIPVHPLGEGATTPERVANEILELLERYAHNVPTEPVIGTRRRVTEGHRRSRNIGLALPWLKVELAREVARQTETEQAVEAFFDSYAEGGSLRKSLQTVHIALAEAASADDETIGASHIAAAQQA